MWSMSAAHHAQKGIGEGDHPHNRKMVKEGFVITVTLAMCIRCKIQCANNRLHIVYYVLILAAMTVVGDGVVVVITNWFTNIVINLLFLRR